LTPLADAAEFLPRSFDKFIYQPGFAVYAHCESTDKMQTVFRQMPYRQAVAGNPPPCMSREKCQSVMLSDQLRSLFRACEIAARFGFGVSEVIADTGAADVHLHEFKIDVAPSQCDRMAA
jgi:hypothetical protein